MKLLDAKNRDEFAEWLLVGEDPKHSRMAKMAGRAQRYIGGLSERSRDAFLEAAIDFAWNNRYDFNAQYEQLGQFWDRSLQAAALTRDKWLVSVARLPGVYEREWVLGRRLGKYERSN